MWEKRQSELAKCQRVAKLSEIFGNVDLTDTEEQVLLWLAGLDNWTVDNVVSAVKKVMSGNLEAAERMPDDLNTGQIHTDN